jgi:hypothetical protein
MLTDSGKDMIKDLLSDEHIKSAGIELVHAYMSCPEDKSMVHKGYFIINAPNIEIIEKFFGPLPIELRGVKPFNEIVKTL